MKITGLAVDAALAGPASADPAAADTRALAGLLYAALTGYWPGTGTTALPPAPRDELGPYPAGQLRAGVPAGLDALLCRALLPQLPQLEPPIGTPVQFAAALASARRSLAQPAPVRPVRAPAAPELAALRA